MRSYARMLEDNEEEKLKVIYHLGLYESVWIRGNVTTTIDDGNGYTDLYRARGGIGFRIKTEY